MTHAVTVHPLVSPWGRFGLYSFYIDAPEPAVVDTGIASSPAEGMAPALEAIGRRVEDVRWILLTHGHIDHIGGAHALWELTGRRAQVVIHEADAPMLRSRRAHVEEYHAGRGRYLGQAGGEARVKAATDAVISGEMEPTMLVKGGETLHLGGDVTVSVHSIPGHTPGSVAYSVDGRRSVFVGDAVQVHGAANGFPGYTDPAAYRSSLEYVRDELRPERLYLGHPYRRADGTPCGVELDGAQAREALTQSLAAESGVGAAARGCLRAGLRETDSPYSPFAPAAEELGYTGDPTLEPSPFFTSMHGYRTHHHDQNA
ncbi:MULTISPECIES: MBL fold metallo-hydrolase [unclassified Streptomyces]|uniref:MBL fold metallo-hydrolase n=1 Tax=unclassified Streptomyces TaxID=2593676 RepID=UPI00081B0A1B|nr:MULTISPECIES: MBL fold metallo-hydrolase [unclassified Streptomyces]MYQ52174.1 MBL fold metallo-hydrolase [Streptomyces sp. SID4941]SCD76986.1 Glyoxylase, beta-lactamase superfamily II [Streptomyces sp. PalvLS-984]SDB89341.1 Glyoxylase, beta-lactamase superfamily II [Streptomyces sp. AmelKG-A3]